MLSVPTASNASSDQEPKTFQDAPKYRHRIGASTSATIPTSAPGLLRKALLITMSHPNFQVSSLWSVSEDKPHVLWKNVKVTGKWS
jgi:hypothetical protein